VVEIGDGEYVASGENQYGELVIGGYDPDEGSNKFYVYDSSSSEYTGLDYTFQFDFVSEDRVEGYMYFYDNFDGEFSNDYPFTGVRN
jgi:hypothetical protein